MPSSINGARNAPPETSRRRSAAAASSAAPVPQAPVPKRNFIDTAADQRKKTKIEAASPEPPAPAASGSRRVSTRMAVGAMTVDDLAAEPTLPNTNGTNGTTALPAGRARRGARKNAETAEPAPVDDAPAVNGGAEAEGSTTQGRRRGRGSGASDAAEPAKRARRGRGSGASTGAGVAIGGVAVDTPSRPASVYDDADDAEDDELVDDLIAGEEDEDDDMDDKSSVRETADEDEDELGGEEEEEEDELDDDSSDDDEDEEEGVNWEGEDELEEDEDEAPVRRSRRAAAVKKAPAPKPKPKGKGKAKATDVDVKEGTPLSEKARRSPKPKPAPRAIRQLPIAAPRNRWGRTQEDVDSDLRSLLDTEEKANAYLASKWIDAKELHRLEGLGLIKYKRGKWSEAERTAMRDHIKGFQEESNLGDAELLEVLMCKGRYDKRSAYPHFWAELSAKVPGRPVKYVVPAVQRMYDPRARKGAWTQAEDTALLEAYEKYPNEWTKISDIVERTVHDCRDRWKCELRDKDRRNTGPWTEDETERLKEAVAKANEQLGLEPLSADTPWDVVVNLMGGTRTRTQCRKKWQDTMGYGHRNTPEPKKRGPRLDPRLLLARMRQLGIKHESDVQHGVVMLPEWGLTPAQLRRKWHHLKNTVPDREGLTFDELLDKIEGGLPAVKEPKAKGGKKAAPKTAGRKRKVAEADDAAFGDEGEEGGDEVLAEAD